MQGFKDPRAQLFWPMLQRIEKYRETLQCILLENTAALAKDRRNKADFETILTALGKRLPEFTWVWNIFNASDYGVPQNRRRLFLAGYRTALRQHEFAWPSPCQSTPNLEDILEPAPHITEAEKSQREEALTSTGKRNLSMAKASIIEAGYDPDTFACCIDIDTGRTGCSNYSVGIARTLTRSRGRSGGPWISNRWRRMTLAEMAGLQGVDLTKFNLSNLSEKDIGAMFLGRSVFFIYSFCDYDCKGIVLGKSKTYAGRSFSHDLFSVLVQLFILYHFVPCLLVTRLGNSMAKPLVKSIIAALWKCIGIL